MIEKSLSQPGAVRGWHVLLLYLLAWSAASVASHYWVQGLDVALEYKRTLRGVVWMASASGVMVLVVLAIPELRRLIQPLLSASRNPLSPGDFALVLAVFATWALGVSQILFVYPIFAFSPHIVPQMDPIFTTQAANWALMFWTLLVSAVIAPLGEELVFRGLLLNLWATRWGLVTGIVMSSVVFGATHGERAFFATGMGFFLAFVFLRTGSLWPGIVLHALFNTSVHFMNRAGFSAKDPATIRDLSSWIPELVLAVLFTPVVILFWRRFRPAES